MLWCAKCKALESEVRYLRSLVDRMQDRLLSLSGDAAYRYAAMSAEGREQMMVDDDGNLVPAMPMNEKEAKSMRDAIDEAISIMGA